MVTQIPVEKLVAELEAAKARYGTFDQMVEKLRPHRGFERITRASIFYWMRQAKPTRRMALALKILNAQPEGELRIAEPDSLWVLPSMLVTQKHKMKWPVGWPLDAKCMVTVERVRTGGEARELLLNGKADVALGANLLLNELRPECSRLCSLTRADIAGIANRKVETLGDLQNLKLGYPFQSALATLFIRLLERERLTAPPPLPFANPTEAANQLAKGRIDGVIGWDPLISHIRASLGKLGKRFVPIRRSLLGRIEIDLAVNLERLKGTEVGALRAYVRSLWKAAEYVENNKSHRAFQKDIAQWMKLDEDDVAMQLASCRFAVENFETETLLTLWEREAALGHTDS